MPTKPAAAPTPSLGSQTPQSPQAMSPQPDAYLTVYTASAGSGKTYTLAAEYIACLLPPEERGHRAVLAMTFTNKATGEMKQRILQYLYALSQGQEEAFLDKVCEINPAVRALDVKARAAEVLRLLLHDYDHFHVQTIDSFFQSLLSNLAHELGLGAHLHVDLDDKAVTHQAVEDLLDSLNRGDGADQRLLRRVRRYIERRVTENDTWQLARALKSFAEKNVLSTNYQLHAEEFVAYFDDEAQTAQDAAKLWQTARTWEPGGNEWEALHNAIRVLRAEADALNREYLDKKGLSFFTLLKKLDDNPCEPPTEAQQRWLDDPEAKIKSGAPANFCQTFTTLAQKLRILTERGAQGRRKRNTCRLILSSLDQLRLLDDIARRMARINAEAERFLLTNTKLIFNKLVAQADAEFIFEKAGTNYRHVLIDEFQDTARMQWENIRKLLLEATGSGNRCLIVGDVKQSIYRWNGGDWSILQHIDREIHNTVLTRHTLDENYRSGGNIVHFNNAFFHEAALLMGSLDSTGEIPQIYGEGMEQKPMRSARGGNVRVVAYAKGQKDAEGTPTRSPLNEAGGYGLVAAVEKLHAQGVSYGEMAILVRRRAETAKLLQHFAEVAPDVPLVSAEAFFFSSSFAVTTLVNALRCLATPADTVAQAALATAYHYIMTGQLPDWEALRQDVSRFLPTAFTQGRDALRRLPLYELCSQLAEIFSFDKLRENPELAGQSAFVMSFLDHVLSYLQDHTPTLPAFLDYWDDTLSQKAIPISKAEGINILTIHKAKGLAFHTVLIPFCDWAIEKEVKAAGAENYLWCQGATAKAEAGSDIPVPWTEFPVTLRRPTDVTASYFGADYEREKQQRRVDCINMAYVAFTRAKENLLVWAAYTAQKETKKKPVTPPLPTTFGDIVARTLEALLLGSGAGGRITLDEDNMWLFEVSNAEPQPRAAASASEASPANPFSVVAQDLPWAMRTYPPHVEFVQSNASRAFLAPPPDEAQREHDEYVARGNLYHLVLSQVRTAADVEPAVAELVRRGVVQVAEGEAVVRFLAQRVAGRAAQWFAPCWQVKNETTLLGRDARGKCFRRRPDRVMEREGEVIVVDFKFGKPQPEHKAQVSDYVTLLHRMKPTANVAGYLWYVYTDQIVPVSNP